MLDIQGLKDEAVKAADGYLQKDLAEELNLNPGTVSRALNNVGLEHAAVQARIISWHKGKPVQKRSTYVGKRVFHKWVIDPDDNFNG